MAEPTRGDLRSAGRHARRSVTGRTRTVAESAICVHLSSVVIGADAVVGAYVADDGEPDLAPLADTLRAAGHRMALPVPIPDSDDAIMSFQPWHAGDVLVPGRFAIPCPPTRVAVVPDVVLVPLVRFDATGARLGRGAGFYDRWLAGDGCQSVTIGVAFECQRSDRLPTQSHDVALNMIVSELGIRWPRPMETP